MENRGTVFHSRVQHRGEVVIPQEIRKHLDVDEGDFLLWRQVYSREVMVTKGRVQEVTS